MIKPLHNFIAVRERELSRETAIALPDQSQERICCGEVMAAGPGKRLKSGALRPMPVKTGDRVLFLRRSARAWFDPKFETDYMLIMDEDVLGVLPDQKEHAA